MINKNKTAKRILIIGASGTGKNWLSEKLSETFKIKFYDLDDIAWEKKYSKKRDKKERIIMVNKIIKEKKWIIAGAGNSYLGEMPKKADLIIVLKSHLVRELYKRHIKRNLKGEKNKLKHTIKGLLWSYGSYHKPAGESSLFIKSLEQKYPKKVITLTKKSVKKYLKTLKNPHS